MIYLYVKTHNKTGLKYLGKTTKADPHKYPGSGKRWLRHLKKHGFDYTTEILLATEDKEELKETGVFFSKLWDIVASKEWANLMEEKGDGVDSETQRERANLLVKNGTHPWLLANRNDKLYNYGHGRGKTYDEIYGEEKAIALRKTRAKENKERWANTKYKRDTSRKISETRKRRVKEGKIVTWNKGKKFPNPEYEAKKEEFRAQFLTSNMTRRQFAEYHSVNYNTMKKYLRGIT
jgi:hypothetical protein